MIGGLCVAWKYMKSVFAACFWLDLKSWRWNSMKTLPLFIAFCIEKRKCLTQHGLPLIPAWIKGLITVGRELRQQHPKWFVVRRRDVPRAQLEGRPRRTTNHEGVVAVTPDRPWSIPIITWLNNVILLVFRTKYVQNHHQIERCRLLASIVTSRISLLNNGSCSFTHPVAKGRSAWGTSSGT